MSSPKRDDIDIKIGGMVRARRIEIGMSLDELSDRLPPDIDLKRGALTKLESGYTRWRVALLLQFAEILGVSFLRLVPNNLVAAALDPATQSLPLSGEHAELAQRIGRLSSNNVKALMMLIEHFETVEDDSSTS
ncbi:MAG: helix-turn-helix domain-containing protein [Porticoccaceae bacterium]